MCMFYSYPRLLCTTCYFVLMRIHKIRSFGPYSCLKTCTVPKHWIDECFINFLDCLGLIPSGAIVWMIYNSDNLQYNTVGRWVNGTIVLCFTVNFDKFGIIPRCWCSAKWQLTRHFARRWMQFCCKRDLDGLLLQTLHLLGDINRPKYFFCATEVRGQDSTMYLSLHTYYVFIQSVYTPTFGSGKELC